MAKMRQEDLEMKIPALLHLSSLGYGYLSRDQLRRRDRKTNIIPDILLGAIERINHTGINPELPARLMNDLQARLDAKDLGRQFYKTIRNGWNGLRLLDFDHPENNLFQSASELACGSGNGSFRPDITLFVNGLPLAMIEVKPGNRSRGLLSEYQRMLDRSHSENVRRYLQCAQVWAFSDNHGDNPNRLLPSEGSFFATVMAEGFPVFAAGKQSPGSIKRFLSVTPEEERCILEDNGIRAIPRSGSFRKNLSRNKPTHKMLTALFNPERFLFLLRYGIRYLQETDPAGQTLQTRRMLTTRQLSGLESLIGKAKRGYLNWTVPSCGAAGENAANASLVMLLQDLEPGARVYWVSADETDLRHDQASLESCGISCARWEAASGKQLILIPADRDPDSWIQTPEERVFSGRRVFILQEPAPQYVKKEQFFAKVRKRDPNAILITRTTYRAPESSLPANLYITQITAMHES